MPKKGAKEPAAPAGARGSVLQMPQQSRPVQRLYMRKVIGVRANTTAHGAVSGASAKKSKGRKAEPPQAAATDVIDDLMTFHMRPDWGRRPW